MDNCKLLGVFTPQVGGNIMNEDTTLLGAIRSVPMPSFIDVEPLPRGFISYFALSLFTMTESFSPASDLKMYLKIAIFNLIYFIEFSIILWYFMYDIFWWRLYNENYNKLR